MSGGSVAERLEAVRERIARAAARAGRRPEDITLVGISKLQPAARVVEAARAGLAHVGENYVQEAAAKQREVRAALEGSGPTLHWHLVGRLQRNKAGRAVELFERIESVDSVALGDALERRAAAAGRRLEVLIQVNLSDEPQKGGVAPEDLPELLDRAAGWTHLRTVGLMTVPAAAEDPERSRPAFARLRQLSEAGSRPGGPVLTELSMGMSADFEVAIEEGATSVRVGTAIFGPRPT